MSIPDSSDKIRKVALAFDNSLVKKDLQDIMDRFADDCDAARARA